MGAPAGEDPPAERDLRGGGSVGMGEERLVGLDLFRGVTVLLMLLVNNLAVGDAAPALLLHAPFGAIAGADLVFPWFILILGISAPLAARSFLRRGGDPSALALRTARRVAVLFLLGCFLDSTLAHAPRMGMGVLQLLALDSGVVGLLSRSAGRTRLVGGVTLLALHSALLIWGPGGRIALGRIVEGANAHVALTEALLSPVGLRGLLSVVPTAGLALLGAFAADRLLADTTRPRKILEILLLGGAMVGTGLALRGILPFSKSIWTASYLAVAGGAGLLLLALALSAEAWGGCRIGLLRSLGANPLLAYALPIYVKATILQGWRVLGGATLEAAAIGALKDRLGDVAGGWSWTVLYILFWWSLLRLLDRRGVRWSA